MISLQLDFNPEGFETQLEQFTKNITIDEEKLKSVANIIVDDIKQGIQNSADLNDQSFVPNTVKWSKRKGNNTPYIATGKLYNSIKITDLTKESFNINVQGLGVNWQTQPKYIAYKRDFFGISIRALNKIKSFLNG